MNKEYIHYGHRHFNPNEFIQPQNQEWMSTKPKGGFWASPLSSEFSWLKFCKDNDIPFCDLSRWFKFRLKPHARVLYIDNVDKLENLPLYDNPRGLAVLPWEKHLDFEKLSQEYDAIEVWISVDSRLYSTLMTWDIDSLLVLNKDIVEEIESSDV